MSSPTNHSHLSAALRWTLPITLWMITAVWIAIFLRIWKTADHHAERMARQTILLDLDCQSNWFANASKDLQLQLDQSLQGYRDYLAASQPEVVRTAGSPGSLSDHSAAVIVQTADELPRILTRSGAVHAEEAFWTSVANKPFFWETLPETRSAEFWQYGGESAKADGSEEQRRVWRVCMVRLPELASRRSTHLNKVLANRWPAERFVRPINNRSTRLGSSHPLKPAQIWLYDSEHQVVATSGVVETEFPGYFAQDQLSRGASGVNARGFSSGDKDVVGGWSNSEYQRAGWIVQRPRSDFFFLADRVATIGRLAAALLTLVSGMTSMFCFGVPQRFYRWAISHSPRSPENDPKGGVHGEGGQSVLGRYTLGQQIGHGGSSRVYRATDSQIDRAVAIKVLDTEVQHPVAIDRFKREIFWTAKLNHPNTIALLDHGQGPAGELFYVMEIVDGMSLQDVIDRFGPQEPARVIHLLLQICDSLSQAHLIGLIHRDVKPANVLVSGARNTEDLVKLVDFGLIDEIAGRGEVPSLNRSISGTPMYMSPESVRENAVSDQRSDLYSVAAVGYALLTGGPLFDAQSSVEVCLAQVHQIPSTPEQRLGCPLPADLQAVLMIALRKDPGERQSGIDQFADQLRGCRDHSGWTAVDRKRWWSDAVAADGDLQQTGRI